MIKLCIPSISLTVSTLFSFAGNKLFKMFLEYVAVMLAKLFTAFNIQPLLNIGEL